MGKVYDALRKAEEERSRRTGSSAPATKASTLDWPSPSEPAGDTRVAESPANVEPTPLPATPPQVVTPKASRRVASVGSDEVNKRCISLLQPGSFITEQFRSLRARLRSLAQERPLRTIATASAMSGEGKTTAAINLAIVSAMGLEGRVLLVDCDLRQPQVHRSFGIHPESGLAEVLSGQSSIDQAITSIEGTNLDVLPVRSQPPNPSELLASSRMRDLVDELAGRYDLVILDTPAILALPDAKSLSELVDGLIMIVRSGVTPREEVQAALDILDRRRVLGLVLNGAEVSASSYYGYAS